MITKNTLSNSRHWTGREWIAPQRIRRHFSRSYYQQKCFSFVFLTLLEDCVEANNAEFTSRVDNRLLLAEFDFEKWGMEVVIKNKDRRIKVNMKLPQQKLNLKGRPSSYGALTETCPRAKQAAIWKSFKCCCCDYAAGQTTKDVMKNDTQRALPEGNDHWYGNKKRELF